ncbi:DUF4253 domain-containing protein [Actinoplanes sp. NPDC049118]|uniref:DUF4253 domain-containing protein n=1 Tax=Actinoplanes sp. NPDC049118 TaxID=3155769 RepID=UPI00340877AD
MALVLSNRFEIADRTTPAIRPTGPARTCEWSAAGTGRFGSGRNRLVNGWSTRDDLRVANLLTQLSGIEYGETPTGVPLVSARFPEGEHDRVWRALRAEHSRTGLWPVLGWTAPQAAEIAHHWPFGPQGRPLLAALRDFDATERMALIVRSIRESCIEGLDPADPQDATRITEFEADFDPVRVADAVAPLTEVPAGVERHTMCDPPTQVLLVPAAAGHEVLALAPGVLPVMNNWTGGPSHPSLEYADHILVLRHWERAWGAQLYYGRGAVLELAVARPPRDPLALATCAIEQSSYCDDLAQTVGAVAVVAREQAPAGHWSFWWD